MCGSLQNRHAHHLNHASYFPEERFDKTNGVVMCKDCHSAFHNVYHKSTKEKCTKSTFKDFVELIQYVKEKLWGI